MDCENSKGFMNCHSFKISVDDEESSSCKNKNKDTGRKHCKDGKKGADISIPRSAKDAAKITAEQIL